MNLEPYWINQYGSCVLFVFVNACYVAIYGVHVVEQDLTSKICGDFFFVQ